MATFRPPGREEIHETHFPDRITAWKLLKRKDGSPGVQAQTMGTSSSESAASAYSVIIEIGDPI
jgi:hypothetical protein